MVKNLPAMQETQIQFLGQEDLLEKEMATHFSILALERGAWQATVHGIAKSQTQLSDSEQRQNPENPGLAWWVHVE